MTTPHERTRAVLHTREFLQELSRPGDTPGLPANIRRTAVTLLRHYPQPIDMKLANLALPNSFGSPDEVDY